MNKLYACLSFLFGLGIVYFLISLSNTQNLTSLLFKVDVFTFLFVGVITLLIAVCATTRWMMLVKTVSVKKISFPDYLVMFLMGRLGSFFLPKEISDIGVRTLLLAQSTTVQRAFLSTILDRISDVGILFLFIIPASLYIGKVISSPTALLLLSGFFALSILMIFFCTPFVKAVMGYLIQRWKKSISDEELSHAMQAVTTPFLGTLFLLSWLRFFFVILRYYVISLVYGLSLPFSVFLLVTPIAQLGYLFSPTPGGLGFLEATWYGVLSYLFVAEEAKISFVLGQRIITFFAVVLCLLFVILWRRK